jgi:hypothetical protein
MLAPVHNDNQVPSPPSLLKVRHQSVRLRDQPVLFWSDWGKSSSREIEWFLHFLGRAYRASNPVGRLASEVLGLKNARVSPALRQELPGDSRHQTRRGQNGDVGSLAKGSLVFVSHRNRPSNRRKPRRPRRRPKSFPRIPLGIQPRRCY